MRPVTLSLDGFGSFRDPAVVDFTEADYFALIGPTGAGKSTVIDAITFALYGSVPRWDNQNIVSLALAPSANRGIVKLVFDVSGARYVVARELRRAKSGQVTVKNVRLDKLDDAQGSGNEGDPSQNLASDRAVTPAIEDLLGLTFDHFCTCVVLPQGDFAEFLHKKPGDRDKLLRSLLGMDIYSNMMQRANSLAKQREAEASAKQGQLERLAHATQEHVEQAAARVTTLTSIQQDFKDSIDRLEAAREHAEERSRNLEKLRAESVALAAVKAPEDLSELANRDRTTSEAVASAEKELAAAEQADTEARRAQSEGPDPESMRNVLRLRKQAADTEEALPKASAAADKAMTSLDEANGKVAEAQVEEEVARATHSDVQDSSRQAALRLSAAESDLTRLATVSAPQNLDDLDARLNDANRHLAQCEKAYKTARNQAKKAERLVDAAPKATELERLLERHEAYENACAQVTTLHGKLQLAVAAQAQAAATLRDETVSLAALRANLQDAQRQDLAGALRPHLHVGEACPVCEQTVTSLPEQLDVTNVAALEKAVADADQALETLRAGEKAASNAVASAEREVTSTQELRDTIQAKLGDSSRSDIQEQLTEVQRLRTALAALQEQQEQAEQLMEDARANVQSMRQELAASAQDLQRARDPLVALGAPAITEDTVASWRSLVTWVAERLPQQEDAVADASRQAAAAQRIDEEARQTLADASARLTKVRTRAQQSALAEQKAQTELTRLTALAEQLQSAVAGKPTVEEASQALQLASQLSARAQAAEAALAAARAAAHTAQQSRADFEGDRVTSRNRLATLRDSVVYLGAPPLDDDDDLAGSWSRLLSWATIATTTKQAELQAAEKEAQTAAKASNSAALGLTRLLQAHDIHIDDDSSAAAAMAFGGALTGAKAAEAQAREDFANRERLLKQIASDQEQSQVANLLGNLLRTDAFPRWLIGSALDVLVADASENLRELSGGQFDLTHEDGAFFIIDHTDAEAQRPVKTLSGGETFQASLALALALSNHLTTLTTDGTAKLESIFLDEGFGTLDDTMLEIVAETLENLASQGNQMVGLVTHVKALAERVPVRFEVTRDQSTSRITRTGG